MSDARLPLAYRDTCAHLLIPLNRCRHNEYYLPWKCEVRLLLTPSDSQIQKLLAFDHSLRNNLLTRIPPTERETLLRKVPVRRVQEACRKDGRAESCKGRREKQLKHQSSSSYTYLTLVFPPSRILQDSKIQYPGAFCFFFFCFLSIIVSHRIV
jgi:hypothetical protein